MPVILTGFFIIIKNMKTKKDTIYNIRQESIKAFAFDDQVADVFTDMINRSVPGYSMIINQIGVLADLYAKPNTVLYDLGCSLGGATVSIRHSVQNKDCRIIAVDNSEAMVKRCASFCERDIAVIPVEVICANIEDVDIENGSVVLLNFVLQFLDIKKRNRIIKRIFEGLVPGGILILSEKLSYKDKQKQALQDNFHEHFKRFNGYSELEISQKRDSLENVLKRETEEKHISRLQTAGFSVVEEWFRCYSFVSFFAKK